MFDTIGHWAYSMGFTKTRFIPSAGTLSTTPVTRDFNPDITFLVGFSKQLFERRYGLGSWDRKSTGIGESWASDNLALLIAHPTNPFSLSAPTATATAVRNSGPGSHVLYYDLGLVYRPGGLSLQSGVLEMMRQLGIGQSPVTEPPVVVVPPVVKPPETPKPVEPVKPPTTEQPPTPVTPTPGTPTPVTSDPGADLLAWVLSLTLRQALGQGLVWLRQVYRALTKVKA